jgi:ABC-type multidrug transport system fused ATPase/permease subunit
VVDDIYDLTQEIGELFYEFGAFNQSMSLIKNTSVSDSERAATLVVSDGLIEFRGVSFYYADNKKVFHDKSVVIEGGSTVGLVGFSGSGKTTFVSLIYRLYDISSGQILIDGQDISKVTQESLRDNISIIPQESILFHRSILENIKCGNYRATDEEVIEAAKLAHVDEFVAKLPKGYDTLCGEGGGKLSGGQRQRIAIARAILKNAPILILDEATSSLDSRTERMIQDSLKYLMQNKTVIVIAHRLSTLLDMDKILVFADGQLVEEGVHDELIRRGKIYSSLWNSQAGSI